MMTTQTEDPLRFLITGAFGAIGVWTIRSLLSRGHEVLTLDVTEDRHRLALALDESDQARLTNIRGDIRDISVLERAIREHRVTNVIHLAALQVPFVRADPVLGAEVNVTGTTNLLEAVRRAELTAPLVYASSIAVYGPAGTLGGDDTPATLYGVYKRANEGTAHRYFEDYGVRSIGLRPHTVFGPARDQGVTSAPTFAMLAAAARTPYRIAFNSRVQLQYSEDVGEAFARTALLRYDGASVHNLDGEVLSMSEIAALIRAALPEAEITVGDEALPLVERVDGESFVELLGGSVMRPAAMGIAAAISRFEAYLARGLVQAP